MIQDGPEALEWLRANGHVAALASNRFSSTADAISFVEQLYAAGARRVFVPADTIVDDDEERDLGGAYSDSIVIELSSSHVPDALSNLYCQEATLEGLAVQRYGKSYSELSGSKSASFRPTLSFTLV